MKPQNKTQLKKWLKENIGAELKFIRKRTICKVEGGEVVGEQIAEMKRVINKVQTNAVNFLGNKDDGTPLVNPSWLYLDQNDDKWEFSDSSFSSSHFIEYTTRDKEGKEIPLKDTTSLIYEYVN